MDRDMQEAKRLCQESIASYQRGTQMLARIREHLRRQQTDDDTPLSLERAVCHPLLGGTLCVDPAADVPGPSFTVSSLRRAILKGDLKCVNHGRLQFVTPAQLRAWITREPDDRVLRAAPPRPPAPLTYAAQTLHEKRQGSASVSLALAALDSIGSTAPALKKRRK